MRKFCIFFLLSIIISLTAVGFMRDAKPDGQDVETTKYLRMHVRADSNETDAQVVKYYVRDRLVEYLTPLVASYETKEKAMQGVKAHLGEIAEIATRALRNKGFSYGATASVEKEYFPTRVYDEYTLPAGEYDALIVRLGRGAGENWWCVVYPPLCFVATCENVVYKSKIKEIIDRF